MAKRSKGNGQKTLAIVGVCIILCVGLMCKYMPRTTKVIIDSTKQEMKEGKEKILEATESYDEALSRITKEKMAKL